MTVNINWVCCECCGAKKSVFRSPAIRILSILNFTHNNEISVKTN